MRFAIIFFIIASLEIALASCSPKNRQLFLKDLDQLGTLLQQTGRDMQSSSPQSSPSCCSDAPKFAMSEGTVAYQTKVCSDSGDVIKLENGAIVQVSTYFGYLGYEKSAVLYGNGHICNIWIAGKKSYKCELLKAPEGRGEPAKEVNISEVKGNGTILILSDGSIYEVDSIDRIRTSLWLGFSDGLLIRETTLINFDSDEAVTVYRIE